MVGVGTFDMSLSLVYEAGLVVSLDFGSTVYPGIGVAYRGRKFLDFMDPEFTGNTSSVVIFVSIGF